MATVISLPPNSPEEIHIGLHIPTVRSHSACCVILDLAAHGRVGKTKLSHTLSVEHKLKLPILEASLQASGYDSHITTGKRT